MSFAITFSELWTYAPEDPEKRLPISQLPVDGLAHIHGRLELRVGGRVVPHMGFWGPDDVCIGEWLRVLRECSANLRAAPTAEYTFDEGEQGQPAFHWVRRDHSVLFSIVRSTLSDGPADTAWKDIEIGYENFVKEVKAFELAFSAELLHDSPVGGKAWLDTHLRDAA